MSDQVEITAERLDVGAIADWVVVPEAGGTSVFVGTTRDTFDGKNVTRLEYEAYEPMAVKELRRLCHDARAKWNDLKRIALWHRIGVVPVKEASVVIAVSTPHRKQAFGKLICNYSTFKVNRGRACVF